MADKGQAVYGQDAIKRRLMKGNPGMGAPGPRDGKQQLSPSNSQSAGPMIKMGNPKGSIARKLAKLKSPS